MSAVRVPNFFLSPTHLSPEIQYEVNFFIFVLFFKSLKMPVGICRAKTQDTPTDSF